MTEANTVTNINRIDADETLLLIAMALNERDSVAKGVRLLKGLVKLSPFTEGVSTVANAAYTAALGWARCQAQAFIKNGTIGHDWDIKTATEAVGPEVYHRAASGQHGNGLPSVALALMSVVAMPLIRDRQLKADPEPTPETVGRSSFHQEMGRLIKIMATKHKVDLAVLWARANRVKERARIDLSHADGPDAFLTGRLDEARVYTEMLETVSEMIEVNSLNPYTTDENGSKA